jgi:centrosomal protein CEP78
MEEHAGRRDRLEYVYKTRGEVPEDDIALNGICDINLSYNKLNSLFIKDLGYFL